MSILEKIKKGRVKKPLFMCMYSGPGVGKCFAPETRVLMHDGSVKEIDKIIPGDQVMGPDSKPRNVIGSSRGESPMYKVTLNKGDSFVCNDRHMIYGSKKNFTEFKVEARDLAKLSKSQIERYKILRTGVNYKTKNVTIDPYFVGIWIGDGKKCLKSLCISNPDKEVHHFLRSFCKSWGLKLKMDDGLNLRLTAYDKGESTKSHPVTPFMKQFVVKSEKRISKEYLVNSRKIRLKLLAGLLDSDGHLTNKTFEICTQYAGLSSDIITLSKSLGFQATVSDKIVDGKTYKRIFISGETSLIPTKIKRKKAEKRLQIKSVLREGFNIKKSHHGEYVGITVDGDNLFLLDNFIIVHNTDFGASFPKPLFFDFEESTHNINVDRIDNAQEYSEVIDGLNEILEMEPGTLEFKSIIFDTIDELERMMHVQIASDAGKKSIDHIGWQKGFDYAVNLWAEFIGVCRMIRDKHKIHFLFLAHSAHKSKDDIEKEQTYMRNTINLHKKSAAFVFGAVEMVLYAKKDISFKKDAEGNTFAKDSNKRSLCTGLSAHYDAKNRLQLDPVMPMPVKNGFSVIWGAYLKAFNQTPGQALIACQTLISKVKDEKVKEQMTSYVTTNKTDITILRTAILRINEIIGEQK